MKNINFLVEILTSEHEYWCAMKHDEWDGCIDRSVWFICIPPIKRGLKRDEVLLSDLEKLRDMEVPNITLSENFPPFQNGITLYNFRSGFPVKKNIKDFVTAALSLESKDIYEYKKLLTEDEPKAACT